MNTRSFVAALKVEVNVDSPSLSVRLIFPDRKVTAQLNFLPSPDWLIGEELLAVVRAGIPLTLFWGDRFEVQRRSDGVKIATGRVIDPSPDVGKKDFSPSPLLRLLAHNRRDMILALCRRKGIRGVREKELVEFSGLKPGSLLKLAEEMEASGLIRILNFTPLFLISRESLAFLAEQIQSYIRRFHRQHPEATGMSPERIRKRFRLPFLIFQLILAQLEKEKKIVSSSGDLISLPSPEVPLQPEEEKILEALEEMCFRGEFRRVSVEEIRSRFRMSGRTLDKLLSLLVARRKIFLGPDGFYLHSHWLEEIIHRLRCLGKKELTVAEFKAITGLTRKYAIPLLELLDHLGVTRRKGSSREIL